MGPVAAARPILRPGPAFLLKQLSGPTAAARPPAARPFSPRTLTSSSSSRPGRQLSVCLRCRLQQHGRVRLYSTEPPKKTGPHEESTTTKSAEETHPAETTDQATTTEHPSSTAPPPSSSSSSSSHQPELPSQADSRRSDLSHSFSSFMDNLQSRAFVASQTLNDLTGYTAIESIKAANARLESGLAAAQETLKRARAHYKAVNAQRAGTQREVTTLLARKDTWSPSDLERFTTLYRQDHELEAAVSEAGAALTDAEADETRLSQALNSGILRRYHEEQIWSDRIRRQSTWGTWGLMGVNVLLFLVLQFVAEPWKRNRLMKGIAAEEKAALEAVRRELEEVRGALARREEEAAAAASAAEAATTVPEEVVEDAGVEAAPVASLKTEPVQVSPIPPRPSLKEYLSDPSLWRPALEDLYSERTIDLRMRDASIIALEGALTGAAVVAAVGFFLMRRS